MDAKTYQEAIEYELLTKAVYQGLLDEQYPGTITVQNNIDIVGRSGVAHQVDVYWEFKQAGIAKPRF